MKQDEDQLISFATLGFFAFSLVHNLANQCTQLLYCVDEAQDYLPPSTQKRLLSTTQYLASVVRDSQALLGNGQTDELQFDLKQCVLEALDLTELSIRQQKVELSTHLSRTLITGDRVILLQILLNVLKNSLQAMENSAEKKLRIEQETKHDMIVLKIHDTGGGLRSQPHLLHTTSRHGHGIGVAFCQHFMEAAFGGKFSLTSLTNGSGCICRLHFPRDTVKIIGQQEQTPVE